MKLDLNIAKQLIEDGGRYQGALLITETTPKLKKTGNPLIGKTIIKRSSKRVGMNGNYANMVNNQRKREIEALNEQRKADGLAPVTVAEFKPKTSWHTPVLDGFNGSIVCNKKEVDKPVDERKLYLKHVVTGDTQTQYLVDGVPATDDELDTIKEFSPSYSKSKSQGLENDIIINAVAFENIKEIRANGNVLKFD
jgi:hypothetical protein